MSLRFDLKLGDSELNVRGRSLVVVVVVAVD